VWHIKIAVKLIETGADVNVTSPDGLTSLHDAAYNGRKEIIRLHRPPAVPLLANGQLRRDKLSWAKG